MKKLIALLLILATLGTVPAFASSLFPSIPATMTEAAPSYGVMKGVDPSVEETLPNGSVKHTYGNVTQADFDAYGIVLAERGYSLPSYSFVGDSLVATVVKGSIQFEVTFDWAANTLVVVYPKGIEIEKPEIPNPFAGYTVIEMGQTVKINGVEVTLDDFGMVAHKNCENKCTVALSTTCKNVSTSTIFTGSVFHSTSRNGAAMVIEMHYINNENHYTWLCKETGSLWSYKSPYVESQALDVLTSVPVYAWFATPKDVLNGTDGILAITLVKGDQKYVLYLRGGE